jgi:DNA-binding HxlR family transcriptional regulator
MNNAVSPLETRTGCIQAAMEVIGQKWTALILRDLATESRRFAELERSIDGLNPRTLSQRLETLKSHDIISCCTDASGYQLTEKGRDLIPILEAMSAWGEKHS